MSKVVKMGGKTYYVSSTLREFFEDESEMFKAAYRIHICRCDMGGNSSIHNQNAVNDTYKK